jgi:DNA-binding beta-propeller fold protein YncE
LLTATGSPLALSAPTGTTPSAKEVAISPNGGLIAAAMGPAGDYVFPFNTSTGGITIQGNTATPAAGYSDDSISFDATSGYLLIGRGITATGNSEVLSYSVSGTAQLGATPNAYASGQDPYALLVDLTGTYLYSANRGSGNISGYSIATGGILTTLTDSPYASGSEVTALAEDNTKKYVVAAAASGSVSSALTLYQFDALTAGQLDAVATYGNGTGVAGSVALAATH